jgi:hypothetical protein
MLSSFEVSETRFQSHRPRRRLHRSFSNILPNHLLHHFRVSMVMFSSSKLIRIPTRNAIGLSVFTSTWQSPVALQVVESTCYFRSITAEVASSSLVVPAISFQLLTREKWLPRLVVQPVRQPVIHSSRPFRISGHDFDRIQVFTLGFDLLGVHGMNVSSSGLLLRMTEHGLNHRWMNFV